MTALDLQNIICVVLVGQALWPMVKRYRAKRKWNSGLESLRASTRDWAERFLAGEKYPQGSASEFSRHLGLRGSRQ